MQITDPRDEEVWLRFYCASLSCNALTAEPWTAARNADAAVREYRERFPHDDRVDVNGPVGPYR